MSNETPRNRGKRLNDIPFSILDLAPVLVGGSPADSFRNSLDLAQHVDKWGYNRYWLAEHHNMPGIASSATAVVIGYIAAGTSRIRVGSGGIMLPNHSPLVIAEQFGTLESMYPGRIDLGLGRAPGTDQLTAQALRRDPMNNGQEFPQQLSELQTYFDTSSASRPVRAIPGEGLTIPIWLLGSSGFSAQLAGQLGLPFSFASHFAPEHTLQALALYRSSFQPSDVLAEPYAMVGANVIAADSDDEAQFLSTSSKLQTLNMLRGHRGQLQPPVENMEEIWNPHEKATILQQQRYAMIGESGMVKEKLQAFLDDTQADEMIINSQIYDHKSRLRSYEILSQVVKGESR